MSETATQVPTAAHCRDLVLVGKEELRTAFESHLGQALTKAMVVTTSAAASRGKPRYVGAQLVELLPRGVKARRPSPSAPPGGPDLAIDVKLVSDYMVRKISESASENVDPTKRTTMDVLQLIHESSAASHEALAERDLNKITEAYATINHYKDAGNKTRAMLQDEDMRRRAEFLTAEPCFLGPDLAALAGHSAGNSSATASRWKTSGKVFSVSAAGGERFPAFQFAEGKPLPLIANLLAILRPARTDWQIAFWFTSLNAYLDGDRPADRLSDREKILMAAKMEIDTLVG